MSASGKVRGIEASTDGMKNAQQAGSVRRGDDNSKQVQQKTGLGQQCVAAASAADEDAVMISAEEQLVQTAPVLSVAQLAAQAGQAASSAAR